MSKTRLEKIINSTSVKRSLRSIKSASVTAKVDYTFASWILKNINYEEQRKINPNRVSLLKQRMLSGQFVPGTSILITLSTRNKATLVNGQHTLSAIVEASSMVDNFSYPLTFVFNRVANKSAIRETFASIDTDLYTRSNSQMVNAYGLLNDIELTKPQSTKSFSYIKCIYDKFTSGTHSDRPKLSSIDKMEHIKNLETSLSKFFSIVESGDVDMKSLIKRSAVGALAVCTLRDCPEQAEEFWTGVANNSGLVTGDPRRSLVKFLTRTSANQNGSLSYAKTVCFAWNKWYNELTIQRIDFANARELELDGCSIEL